MAASVPDPLAAQVSGGAASHVVAQAADEPLPDWDADVPAASPASGADAEVPVAMPVRAEDVPSGSIPVAAPVRPAARAEPEEPVASERCGYCNAPRAGDSPYCLDCGLLFPTGPAAELAPPTLPLIPVERLAERYQCNELISAREGVTRYRGLDFGAGPEPAPVVLVRMALSATTQPSIERAQNPDSTDESGIGVGDLPPQGESATGSFTDEMGGVTRWPGLGWERGVLQKVAHRAVPRLLDHFEEGDFYYLVEEAFTGTSLWDAWDDPSVSPRQTFEWLAEVAEGLRALHEAGGTLESIRPDIVVITADGRAAINDLSDLLPLPLPANPRLQATPYTAPELVLASEQADARAALYSFGAMLFALHLGRELTELDFVRQGVPKPFVPLFPDAHPALARIIMKTFVRDKQLRFPTEDALADDPTGFAELIHTLRAAARTLLDIRLDIASWTTIGMMRTGNEDAFALLHAAASEHDRLGDDVGERLRGERLRDEALLILADGMGGVEAGEIASIMAIQGLRELLLRESCFAGLTAAGRAMDRSVDGPSDRPDDRPDDRPGDSDFSVQACQELLVRAFKEVNRRIHEAAHTPGRGKPGMGCTAEVVYVRGRNVVVGHVGDSRTYHYSGGRITLLTRDQTLVNRLVELGHLTPEEAETHPRKHELQQALGGQPDVDPMTYETALKPGDWLIICTDGLSNHVDAESLTEMIQESDSAETCARRLVNLANLQGGSDNCTVIAVRAT